MITKVAVVEQKQRMYERVLYSFDDVIHWHDYALLVVKSERIIMNQLFAKVYYQIKDESSIQ